MSIRKMAWSSCPHTSASQRLEVIEVKKLCPISTAADAYIKSQGQVTELNFKVGTLNDMIIIVVYLT
jgi:hypothetical protein